MTVERWQHERGARRQAIADGPSVRVVIGAKAGWRAGLIEVTVPPGGAMPEHDHGASEVALIAASGRARLVTVADGTVTELEPGVTATIPVGERVRLENPGESEARLLAVLTPPDFAAVVESWPPAA